VLDAQSLSRLARRHPEILRRIRNVAEARTIADEAARSEGRTRKPRAPSPRRSKRDEPETL
jgi:hypothetical protein